MRRFPLLAGFLSLLALAAYAQTSYVGMAYNLSFPTGDTKTFVNSTSYLGFSFEARRIIRSGISAGLTLAWNGFEHAVPLAAGFEEKRGLTSVPILATTHAYYRGESIIPFVGVGAGTIYTRATTRTDQRDLDETLWHLAFMPEAGCIIRFTETAGLILNLRYLYGLEAKDVTVSYWTAGIGLIWTGE